MNGVDVAYADELDMATGGLAQSGDFDDCGSFGDDVPAIQVLPPAANPIQTGIPQAVIDAATVIVKATSINPTGTILPSVVASFQTTYNGQMPSGTAPLPSTGVLDSATMTAVNAVYSAANPPQMVPGINTAANASTVYAAGESEFGEESSIALDILMGRR